MLRFLYSRDGFLMRDATPEFIDERDREAVELGTIHKLKVSEIVPSEGEIEFDHVPSEAELLLAFPNRLAAIVERAKEVAAAVILEELSALDSMLPRAVEDMWQAMAFNTSTLPQAQQDRLARKIELRAQLAAL